VMILVTTAGKVGSHAARLLAENGQRVRIIVRDPDAHKGLAAAGVELFRGDLDQQTSIAEAVSGATSIVLVTAAIPTQEITVIDAARKAKTAHITKITSDASADSPIARRRDHHHIEKALIASGLPHTLLRANAYMQNFLALAPAIAATSSFSSPSGDGHVGMVDARDVAAVSVTIARNPQDHAGAIYRLSGPASLSYDDVADQLSRLLGRTISHERISTEQQEAAMVQMGMPVAVAHTNAQALALFAAGDSDWTSLDIERLTHRPATTFTQFATDHADRFAREIS